MRRLLLVLLVAVFGSCNFFDQEVYVDIPDHENRIVFNSFVSTKDSVLRFLVTRSVDVEDTESVGIALRNADIDLAINGNPMENVWFADSAGHYLVEYEVNPGDLLEVNISANNLPPVSASTVVPLAANVTKARFDGERVDFDGYEYDAVRFTIEDIPGERNFYEVFLIISQYYTYDSVDYYSEYEIDYLESPLPIFSWTPRGLAFSDAAFRDSSIELEVWTDHFHYSGVSEDWEVYIGIRSTTESYYEYMTIYDIHEWNQYPDLFSGEPVPMYTNIQNGYGVFGAYNESRSSVEEGD